MENFPLQAEVIYARPTSEIPEYLQEATFPISIVCSPKKKTETTVETQEDKLNEGCDFSSLLDEKKGKDHEQFEATGKEVEEQKEQSIGLSYNCDETNFGYSSSDEDVDRFSNAVNTLPDLSVAGRQINVKLFLEIFNSESESPLEASQCDALIYALKNRLAVIQGEYVIIVHLSSS